MRCPICGAENANNVSFCTACGTALHDSTSGFMDGLDTSNLDLDAQFNSGFGKRNTGEQPAAQPQQTYQQPQQPYSQPAYQQPQQQYSQPAYQQPRQQTYSQPQQPATNDPYASNNYGAAQQQNTYAGYQQQAAYSQNNYSQQQYNQGYGAQGYNQQQSYQPTGFAQNNAAFNNPANGFANPSYSGNFGGAAATRKKSNAGVIVAIIIVLCLIGAFGFFAIKYAKKASKDQTIKMKCISVTLAGDMTKDDNVDEKTFVGSYDSSTMDVTAEMYSNKDASFAYFKVDYPGLTEADLASFSADTFVSMWVTQMDSQYSNFELINNMGDKAKCITQYEGDTVYMLISARKEGTAFYVSAFFTKDEDRSTYESKFDKWEKTIKITDQ